MDDFLQSFLVGGRDARADENDADLSLSDGGSLRLVVTFGQVGVYQGDLAPRADGTRGYALYVESAQAA
jgi:hypothetical protein